MHFPAFWCQECRVKLSGHNELHLPMAYKDPALIVISLVGLWCFLIEVAGMSFLSDLPNKGSQELEPQRPSAPPHSSVLRDG
jgi:hypothetical protein